MISHRQNDQTSDIIAYCKHQQQILFSIKQWFLNIYFSYSHVFSVTVQLKCLPACFPCVFVSLCTWLWIDHESQQQVCYPPSGLCLSSSSSWKVFLTSGLCVSFMDSLLFPCSYGMPCYIFKTEKKCMKSWSSVFESMKSIFFLKFSRIQSFEGLHNVLIDWKQKSQIFANIKVVLCVLHNLSSLLTVCHQHICLKCVTVLPVY